MYITIINSLMFIISIAVIIFIIIIIILTVISISIIIIFVKSAWLTCLNRQLSPAILVSHDFWRQIFAHFFIYVFFVQKLQHSMN